MNKLILFILVLTSAPFAGAAPAVIDQQEYLHRSKGMPVEVQKWIERAIQCYQLKGEPSYDSQRQRFIKAQLKESHCTMVQRDGSRLSKKYHKRADVVRTVKDAKRDFGKMQKPIRN